MKLELLKDHWDAFGRTDPLWAILTDPEKRGGRWQLDEFLVTGRFEVAEMLELLEQAGVRLQPGRALDFGCGIGRLTQALADHFDRCDGVDIAGSMVARARELNNFGERVFYHVNQTDDLALFEDACFDLVLSLIVFQHMEPRYMESYLREFVRVLKPGGVALFQIPSSLHAATEEHLAPEAVRAGLEFVGDVPAELGAGDSAVVQVSVCNQSLRPWPAGLRVGNRWSGPAAVRDDGRANLVALGPGERAQVQLELRAPPAPGAYTLEVDVLQEGVTWFAEHGSPVATAAVEVLPSAGPAVDDQLAAPRMEMYAMPVEQVLALVRSAGGEIVASKAIDSCGEGIRSYHYVVRR